VIGYGNSLRNDDGVGRYVAERLAGDPRLAGAIVIGVHQLAPELALDVSRADLLVLVDAGGGPAAGTFTIEPLERSDRSRTRWSHHLDPASLLALADELYGCSPATWVVTVGIESIEVGDHLSPAVEAVLPTVVESIVELAAGPARVRSVAGPTHA
jgi:hydrogenase maturation protease